MKSASIYSFRIRRSTIESFHFYLGCNAVVQWSFSSSAAVCTCCPEVGTTHLENQSVPKLAQFSIGNPPDSFLGLVPGALRLAIAPTEAAADGAGIAAVAPGPVPVVPGGDADAALAAVAGWTGGTPTRRSGCTRGRRRGPGPRPWGRPWGPPRR